MAGLFGLDFGTTNSLVSFVQEDREAGRPVVRSLTHLTDGRPHPSVVWFAPEGPVVGREARDQMSELGIGVFGDILRSPKAYLGGPAPVVVGGVVRSSVDVAAELFRHLRADALSRGFPEQDFARARRDGACQYAGQSASGLARGCESGRGAHTPVRTRTDGRSVWLFARHVQFPFRSCAARGSDRYGL